MCSTTMPPIVGTADTLAVIRNQKKIKFNENKTLQLKNK